MSQDSLIDAALISVRLVTMDYYMSSPSTNKSNNFDPLYSLFRSAPISKVPVLRVFGTTLAGQKACLHIHGIFPYLYIPMPPGDNPGFLYRLASSLDKALNIAKNGNTGFQQHEKQQNYAYDNPNHHHVYKIVEVKGRPYYGYHPKEHRYAKIYLYNPYDLRKASDLLANGSVMGQVLQPHYGHIPYTLQFMMDYNLQGMSLIHVKAAKFRHPNPKVTYEASQVLFWPGSGKDPQERHFNVNEMTEEMLGPDDFMPMTTCQVELDAVAADLLNSNEDLTVLKGNKKSGNPGLEIIWEDERLRRLNLDLDLEQNPLTPPSSPPRQRSPSALTDSEKFWNERFHEALENWKSQGFLDEENEAPTDDLDATVNFDPNAKVIVYPEESSSADLQSATFVEEHLKSLSIDDSQNVPEEDIFLDKTDYFDDTVIDEEAISQLLEETQIQTLDSDDDELIDLLHELKEAPKTSQKSDSSASLILSTQSQKDKVDQVETLEMSQIVWDEGDIFENENTNKNVFDDDSFWEEYDFDKFL